MRITEQQQRTSTITVLVKMTCDLCGREARAGQWHGSDHSCWDVNETEVEVTVRSKEGQSYPEGGSGTEFVVDVCPWCFRDRLLPWLRSQGAHIEEREWDW